MKELIHLLHNSQHQIVGERVEQQAPIPQLVLRRSTRVSRDLDCYVLSLDYVMMTDCEDPSCYDEGMTSLSRTQGYAIRIGLIASQFHMEIGEFTHW